jgi:hypothetical protein
MSPIGERSHSRVVASHSVDASARRSGCPAEIKIRPRRAIERERRSKKKLPDIHCAAQKIAADQIRVPPLKACRLGNGSSQNAIAKSWCETRDLAFD